MNACRIVYRKKEGHDVVHMREFWKYRGGDYRLICKLEDYRLVVLVLRLGHRREIYRKHSRK